MPNRNYQKGYRVEREILQKFQAADFQVVRSAGSHGAGDLYVEGLGSVQIKARKSVAIYNWFEGANILVLKADRKEPLVVVPLNRFLELLREANK